MNLVEGAAGGEARRQDHRLPPRAHRASRPAEGECKGTVGVAEHLGSDTFLHVHTDELGTDQRPRRRRDPGHPRRHRLPHPRPGQDPQFDASRKGDLSHASRGQVGADHRRRPRHRRAPSPGPTSPKAPRSRIGDIDIDRAEATAAEIGPAAYAVALDVTDQASIDAAIADRGRARRRARHPGQQRRALRRCSRSSRSPAPATTGCSASTSRGTLFALQAAARQMIAQGHGGKIINMASQAGRRGEALVAVYCATKAAVISLTQSAGLEPDPAPDQRQRHRPRRRRRRALGRRRRALRQATRTARSARRSAWSARRVPYGRMGTAEDLTGMAVFLASEDADYIVAQTYNVDGGQWMS